MEAIINFFTGTLNTVAWLYIFLPCTIVGGLYLTIRNRGIQFTRFGYAMKNTVGKMFQKQEAGAGAVTPLQAVTTALAATVGTGNIVGVGTAIALGGPGAVLWCWLTGVFGIATKYAESLIAVKYRVKTRDGRMLGGAMYALERGMHMKWLGVIFALFAVLASFGIGSGVQSNAISKIVCTTLPVQPWMIGVTLAVITSLVIFGGVKMISKVCERLVPVMAVFYVVGCLIILGLNYDYVWPAVKTIVTMAFRPGAAAGGLVGSGLMIAARYGIARGLFSNESGMGSAPIVSAAAQTRNPVRQALVSSTGTFWDTVVVCLLTGLVLVSSILKNPTIDVSNITDGGELSTLAFGQIPYLGPVILTVGIITFAYSTLLGWSYYGERCTEYLFGKRALIPYRILYLIVLTAAPMISLNLVWEAADTLNALMAIPNLVAVLLLSGRIARETRYYLNGRLDEVDDDDIPVVDK